MNIILRLSELSMKMRNVSALVFLPLMLFSACRKDAEPDLELHAITVNSPEPGTILVSPCVTEAPEKGHLRFLNARGEISVKKELPGAAFCFRKWDINGKVRYTYYVNDVTKFHTPGINQWTGYLVIADSSLNEIKKAHLLPYEDITAGNDKPDLDVHDTILLSDDHFYTMAYYPKRVTNIPASLHPAKGVTVVACIIQEVENGEVVWQWDSSNYPEFYTTSVEANDFSSTGIAHDYMHTNSMIIDPKDGNLILSSRNQNQVIKISRKNGDVIWRLGGKTSDFPLSGNQFFLRQHHATLIEDGKTILLFDNGAENERELSRVLEFRLDELNKRVLSFSAFNIPEKYSQFMGSVQKRGNYYFIGGGSEPYVLEINYKTGQKVLELKGEKISYRAYKY
jgi:arylsulfate sulfotransferase